MSSRKDYIRASEIIRERRTFTRSQSESPACKSFYVHRYNQEVYADSVLQDSFERFFMLDNPAFDVDRFRAACQPIVAKPAASKKTIVR